ncbi:MAG TPA: hypothetical protein VF121_11525 [Thermoanaerobaculia bacterium]|nr:hypothetical protein [Thermoanaerobaculia bacterium]
MSRRYTLGCILLACAGLAGPRPLAAAVDRWSSTGPDVATVRALAVAPTGEVYAGTPFGVFRSTDRGGRWSRLDPPRGSFQVHHLAVDPGDPRRVYAADNDFGALYRSTAGGPWRLVAGHPADHARLFAVAPLDPDRLYIVEGSGVHARFNSPRSPLPVRPRRCCRRRGRSRGPRRRAGRRAVRA